MSTEWWDRENNTEPARVESFADVKEEEEEELGIPVGLESPAEFPKKPVACSVRQSLGPAKAARTVPSISRPPRCELSPRFVRFTVCLLSTPCRPFTLSGTGGGK